MGLPPVTGFLSIYQYTTIFPGRKEATGLLTLLLRLLRGRENNFHEKVLFWFTKPAAFGILNKSMLLL